MEARALELGYNTLCMEGMAVEGNIGWFANTTFNGIFKVDLRTCKAEYVGMFPDERARQVHLYSACYSYGDEILFVPFAATSLCVYNKRENSISTFRIEDEKGVTIKRFYITVQRRQFVYMLSCNRPYIICFDIVTKEVKKYRKWYHVFEKQYPEVNYLDFAWAEMLMDGEDLYIPCCSKNVIVHTNLITEETELIFLDDTICGVYTICKKNNDYYITTTKGDIYVGRCDGGMWKTNRHIGTVEGAFCKSLLWDDKIWLFPKNSGNIYCVSDDGNLLQKVLEKDLDSGQIDVQTIKSYHEYNVDECFMVLHTSDNKCYVMLNDGFLYCIYNSCIQKLGRVQCSSETEKRLWANWTKDGQVFNESGKRTKQNVLDNSFEAYCEYLSAEVPKESTCQFSGFGEIIYKEVRDKLNESSVDRGI